MDNNELRLVARRRLRRKRNRYRNVHHEQASDSSAESSLDSAPSPKRACEHRGGDSNDASEEERTVLESENGEQDHADGSRLESENGELGLDPNEGSDAEQQQNRTNSESEREVSEESDEEPHQDQRGNESGNETSGASDNDGREEEQHQDERPSSDSERDSDQSIQSDSDESDGDHDNHDDHDNEPLYEGAPITLRESALAILSFVLSYALSAVCINDLLSLIALHCGPNSRSFKSIHMFKKYFSMLGNGLIVRHYFCATCEVPLETTETRCNTCQESTKVSYTAAQN